MFTHDAQMTLSIARRHGVELAEAAFRDALVRDARRAARHRRAAALAARMAGRRHRPTATATPTTGVPC